MDPERVFIEKLKNRVRLVTEGAVVMVCPVLLAASLNKVQLTTSKGHGFVRGSISPLSALTLVAGLLSFLCLCICLSFGRVTERVAHILFVGSKCLVHLCALLLMLLALGILLLVDQKHVYYVPVPVVSICIILWRCWMMYRYDHGRDAEMYTGDEQGRLETSVDFSAAVTALLFLGLEGLALEGQSRSAQKLHAASLVLCFVACLLGVLFMLLATVPPMITDARQGKTACTHIEAMNMFLAGFFALNVFLITWPPLGELACLVWIQLLVSLLAWVYENLTATEEHTKKDVTPATMELTKVIFAGFLAVSVPAVSNKSVSGCTSAFVLITGTAVITGLLWRVLTHWTPAGSSMIKAINFACFCTHLYVCAATIPFAFMAYNALMS
ncbi:hypothetical protein ACQJBY_004816 [Aegilops geniculata]